MNREKNYIPLTVRKIHLIGICGTAMGALALSLKSMGYGVVGSDQAVYPPMNAFLESHDILIQKGYSANHIDPDVDLVVIGNTAKADNEEVLATIKRDLPYCSLPQAVTHFMGKNKKLLVITGTHGKTTTSSLLAWILESAGYDPSFLIGGIVKNFNCNFKVGAGDYLVLEGDEYDTAFFDKGPKFMHYPPHSAILTSVEFDHADIYKDISAVQAAFRGFVGKMSPESMLFANDTGEYLEEVIQSCPAPVLRYGRKLTSDWHLGKVSIHNGRIMFEVYYAKTLFGAFTTTMPGIHNLMNILACIGVLHRVGVTADQILQGLETFQGIQRRQEIRGVCNQITVMDDFAHHPTAVAETICAVKPFYPKGHVIAVFEPRTNSSRRNFFQNDYPNSFSDADIICIPKPPMQENIDPAERFSSEQLVKDLQEKGKTAYYFESVDDIISFLKKEARPNDVILIMSNGGFENIHERLLTALQNL